MKKKFYSIVKIIFIFIWLFIIMLSGSIILGITSSRVGQHKSSAFGKAYKSFEKSWGGEINLIPANFFLEKKYYIEEYNSEIKKYEKKAKIDNIEIIPNSIQINSNINLLKKKYGLINFNSFIVNTNNEYILINNTDRSEKLMINIKRPENANIIYDFLIFINDKKINSNFNIDKPFLLFPKFKKTQRIKINIQYTLKGLDVIKYNLKAFNKYVLSSFNAIFTINTSKYKILRFGFPHEIKKTENGEQLIINMENFTTTQDIGITFISQINYLNQIQKLIENSPISLIMFILIVFVLSQIKNIRFNLFHYLFIGIINVFYFLFIAYIIRFFNIFITYSFAFILTSIMYLVYIPNITNKNFAFKLLAPYHLTLTVIFSLIFLLPIYRGISLIILLFIIFISIMIPIGKSNISKWPILLKNDKEKGKSY